MKGVNALGAVPRMPARIHLPRAIVRSVAAKIHAAVPTVGGSLVRMKLPATISGVAPEHYGRMKKLLKRYKPSLRFVPGAAASFGLGGTVDDLVPGGNFSAALSYGDITVAGVGTTSYVCDGQALAFGHPMTFGGRTELGAGSADSLTIVPDPLGPFKLANVGSPLGTLDQDRLAGVRAVDGEPPTIPVTTAMTSLDSGRSHVGETDVVLEDALPDLAFTHIFSNIDSVFDKIGSGSASYTWTIEGTREDGTPWELHRSNMYVSDFDLSSDSAFEIYDELIRIAEYPNEKVSFTSVQATVDLDETVRDYELLDVLFCRHGSCRSVPSIRARPGQTLRFRATLRPSDGAPDQTVAFELTIPPSARSGATVSVGGGTGCIFIFGECGFDAQEPETFDKLLSKLEHQKPNEVLAAQLFTGRKARVRDHADTLFDQVVSGSVQIPVFFPKQCCPPDVPGSSEGDAFFRPNAVR